MSVPSTVPLTEPQARRVAVTLAHLERQLQALRDTLLHPPGDLRLTRREDRFGCGETAVLLPAIEAVEKQLGRMADDLRLAASIHPVRRSFVAALELASIALYELRPTGDLRGYGEVAPSAAAYLEREMPKLEKAVTTLLKLLGSGAAS